MKRINGFIAAGAIYFVSFIFYASLCAAEGGSSVTHESLSTQKRKPTPDWGEKYSFYLNVPSREFVSKATGSKTEVAYKYFEANGGRFGIKNLRQDLILTKEKGGANQTVHLKFQQLYKGLEVLRGGIVVHFNRQGVLESVNGSYYHDIDVPTNPTVDIKEAEKLVIEHLGGINPTISDRHTTKLIICPHHDGNYYLAWYIWAHNQSPPPSAWEYFVDALSGKILYRSTLEYDTEGKKAPPEPESIKAGQKSNNNKKKGEFGPQLIEPQVIKIDSTTRKTPIAPDNDGKKEGKPQSFFFRPGPARAL